MRHFFFNKPPTRTTNFLKTCLSGRVGFTVMTLIMMPSLSNLHQVSGGISFMVAVRKKQSKSEEKKQRPDMKITLEASNTSPAFGLFGNWIAAIIALPAD